MNPPASERDFVALVVCLGQISLLSSPSELRMSRMCRFRTSGFVLRNQPPAVVHEISQNGERLRLQRNACLLRNPNGATDTD